jgi:hypothetical protein
VIVARRAGRNYTVGEYRAYLIGLGERGKPVLKVLEGQPDAVPVDPPSGRNAVYVTSECDYARWYAARSRGDLYQVVPDGPLEVSTEDS